MTTVIGASREILNHHAALHWRACPASASTPLHYMVCPCFTTMVMACGACHDALFITTAPRTWCHHAADHLTTSTTHRSN